MSMLRYRQGVAYIRCMRPDDKADSIMTAAKMEGHEIIASKRGRRPYVLVRHGYPSMVITSGLTKRAVRRSIMSSRPFKETCRWFRETSRGGSEGVRHERGPF